MDNLPREIKQKIASFCEPVLHSELTRFYTCSNCGDNTAFKIRYINCKDLRFLWVFYTVFSDFNWDSENGLCSHCEFGCKCCF